MAVDVPRDLRRWAIAVAVAVALSLPPIWPARADPGGVRPTGHGLANAQDPGPASPAMAAFFRPEPEVALPEAQNASEPAWSLTPPGPLRTEAGMDRKRMAALVAIGALCGAVGIALFVAASMAYVMHMRRSSDDGRGIGSGSGFGLLPRRCQEIGLP